MSQRDGAQILGAMAVHQLTPCERRCLHAPMVCMRALPAGMNT